MALYFWTEKEGVKPVTDSNDEAWGGALTGEMFCNSDNTHCKYWVAERNRDSIGQWYTKWNHASQTQIDFMKTQLLLAGYEVPP